MNLLIITQKVDKEDPVLGFMHDWVKEFSNKFKNINVICLEKGKFDLPANAKVYSLGKEAGRNKIKYVSRLFYYIFGLAREYDAVLVHMNQEYVLLGGVFWKILGKKVFLWRNHQQGNIWTRLAAMLSDKIFYTSAGSYTARFKKALKMPVGIDTQKFSISNLEFSKKENKILSLGRISPIKNIHLMMQVVRILMRDNVNFTLDIYGDPVNSEDSEYKKTLIENNKDLIGLGLVSFHPGVPPAQTPGIYNAHDIFLNFTPAGSFDKTILEAAACGCLPIIINRSLDPIIFEQFVAKNEPEDIAQKIEHWFVEEKNKRNQVVNQLTEYVAQNHSLNILADELTALIQSKK